MDEAESKKEGKGHGRLPILLEFVFSISTLLLLCVALIVAGLSYLSGASILDIFLRAVISTVVLGIILWLISYHLSMGTLGAVFADQWNESHPKAGKDEGGEA